MSHIDTSPAALRKPRRELLELAEKCGASLTGKPDESESITVVFTIEAWRTFDASLLAHREAYAKAAVAAERGRCAKLCKEIAERKGEKFFGQVISDGSAAQCERAIRAQKGTV